MSEKGESRAISPKKHLTCIIGRNGYSYWLDFQEVFAILTDEGNDQFSEFIANSGTSVLIDLTPDEIMDQFMRRTH